MPEGLCMRHSVRRADVWHVSFQSAPLPWLTHPCDSDGKEISHCDTWWLCSQIKSTSGTSKGIIHAYADTHAGDNGITSSVWRVTALDSDERGMSQNTFSFPLRGKLWGRGSCLYSMVCVQGKLQSWIEEMIQRVRNRMMMLLVNCWDCD